MDASVLVTYGCAAVAAAGTGVLVGRCVRAPRMDIIAWAFAVAAIAVSLGAQALGAHNGYTSATFRAAQVGAQLIAPLWLAWGMVELAGRSISARFGAKLVTAALTVVGAVVLITDPLATTPFSTSWPLAAAHYQIIPRSVLSLVAAVTVVTVVITLILALVRVGRDPAWRRPLIALAAAGVAAVALLCLRFHLPQHLAYPALCAGCAALASFGGMTAGKASLDRLHWPDGPDEEYEAEPDDGWAAQRAPLPAGAADETAVFGASYPRRADSRAAPPFMDDDWYRLDRGRAASGQPASGQPVRGQPASGQPPSGQPASGQPARGQAAAARHRQDGGWQDGGQAMNGAENGGRDYRPGDRFVPAAGGDIALTAADAALAREKLRPAREAGTAGQASAGMTPAREAGAASAGTAPARDAPARDAPAREAAAPAGAGAAPARPTPAGGATADPDATRRLFGLIAIYTLAEGRAAEFDSLAGRIVEKVRASEPDTLVYAVHSVPNAPMQRIVYEVYRDHAAYEEHQRQPHIQCFGRDRAPYVVATNVIELGTQQAKLSPLPGLTQMFGRASGD